MADARLLARAYHALMVGFVQDGRAPHYTELAERFGLTPAVARQAQRDLAASGLPVWMYPDTDHVAALSPFSNVPTPYRVSVDAAADAGHGHSPCLARNDGRPRQSPGGRVEA